MHPSCAQEILLCLHIFAHASKSHSASSLDSAPSDFIRTILVTRNLFFVLVLGFDVVESVEKTKASPRLFALVWSAIAAIDFLPPRSPPGSPRTSSLHSGGTSYQALLEKFVGNVHNFEHRTTWSNRARLPANKQAKLL